MRPLIYGAIEFQIRFCSGYILLLLTVTIIVTITIYLYGPLSHVRCVGSHLIMLIPFVSIDYRFHMLLLPLIGLHSIRFNVHQFRIRKCILCRQVQMSSRCDGWRFSICNTLYNPFSGSHSMQRKKIRFDFPFPLTIQQKEEVTHSCSGGGRWRGCPRCGIVPPAVFSCAPWNPRCLPLPLTLSLSLSLSLSFSLPTPPIPERVEVPRGAGASCSGCTRRLHQGIDPVVHWLVPGS